MLYSICNICKLRGTHEILCQQKLLIPTPPLPIGHTSLRPKPLDKPSPGTPKERWKEDSPEIHGAAIWTQMGKKYRDWDASRIETLGRRGLVPRQIPQTYPHTEIRWEIYNAPKCRSWIYILLYIKKIYQISGDAKDFLNKSPVSRCKEVDFWKHFPRLVSCNVWGIRRWRNQTLPPNQPIEQ